MAQETKQSSASFTPLASPPAIEQFQHKNNALPIGPATGKPLGDWRKDRDYENFMPSPHL